MTGSPRWKFLPSSTPVLILVSIALAAAVPRLLLGYSQYIEYDGYWHVFIARQDNWSVFWSEVYANAHPPLYFLLLKAVLRLGHSLLLYRSISLATGVASVFLTGWIARKVTGSNIRAYQSALAYGLALPAIIISCEVRSYMLSVFFVLLSFMYLLDIAGSGNPRGEGKARTGFAAGAILACLSHYFAFFYSGAAMALLAGRFAVRRFKGENARWKAETAAEAATILPVVAVVGTLYGVHAGQWAQIQNHLLPFYYDPQGREAVTSFLSRNWTNFVNLFSPFHVSSGAVALGVLMLALAGTLMTALLLRRDAGVQGTTAVALPALWTIVITGIMMAGFVLGSLAGKYPFGGDLRQQYLLFPFLVLSVAIFVERMAAPAAAFVPGRARLLLNSLAIAAIVWVSAVRYDEYPKVAQNIVAEQMGVFDRLERAPTAVYVDQLNLITFFIYHHTWDWSFLKLPQPVPGIDVYRLRRGPDQMLVFRDKTKWNVDPDDPGVYGRLAQCLRAVKMQDLSLFSARQTPPKPPLSDLPLVRRDIVTLASKSGVCAQRVAVTRAGWYGNFRESNCAPVSFRLPQVTGRFDDVSEDIQFTGMWTHGTFPQAAGGTVSYSNDPGSVARLSFEGDAITYVYTKAFNRGVAEVKLDGISRAEIDLYSPGIVWQARTAFRGLGPGKHTFELIVAGRKETAATDRYVDIDSLVVR